MTQITNQSAKFRYDFLRADRDQFLQVGIQAAQLTLPYLIRQDDEYNNRSQATLQTPWQAVGAKGVVTLASKLMLALLPAQTSFFKLQLDEAGMNDEEMDPQVKSELDLSFAKIERTINETIAASDDRVVVHQALKHLVVTGNALILMSKDKLKMYPLNRYVVDRDGYGNVIEIVTKERINRNLVEGLVKMPRPNPPGEDGDTNSQDVDVFTHVKRVGDKFKWYQEVFGKKLPKSDGQATMETNPWLVLRFNTSQSEDYGRGRVEEFMGDLKSLEALSQAVIEGSAAASKVVFMVSPSSTTKPQTLANAGNGAIVQGRPEDIGVVQVGKTADFSTAYQMIQSFEKRLSEAFLILNVRDSERTTAEEVRMTQMELEQQLGGLFSVLTAEFLHPYLRRKLSDMQKSKAIPKIPKELVKPTIVAGMNAIGRGMDREALMSFVQTISQTMGPEAIQKYINPDEMIKRLAASSGIDYLNLVKTQEELQQEAQQSQQQEQQMALTQQASQFERNQIDGQANIAAQEAAAQQAPAQGGPPQGGPPPG